MIESTTQNLVTGEPTTSAAVSEQTTTLLSTLNPSTENIYIPTSEPPISIFTTSNSTTSYLSENTFDNLEIWRYLYCGLGILLSLIFLYCMTKLKEKNIGIEAMKYYNLYWLVFGILIVLSLMLCIDVFKGFAFYLWIGYVTCLIVMMCVLFCWIVESNVLDRQVPPVSYQ